MKNILVFCAGGRQARANYELSILKPVSPATIFHSFPAELHRELRKIETLAGGFYVWGTTPPASAYFWEQLAVGDGVLSFFDYQYRAVTQLVGKAESAILSRQLWGGEAWSRIMFLSKPQPVNIDAKEACPPLYITYRGITRIGPGRVADILSEYGSISQFLEKKFGYKQLGRTPTP
jgi:hypothetical protein